MVLVTTAINDLLELEDDILLLGAWCRGYSLSSKNNNKKRVKITDIFRRLVKTLYYY